MTSWWKAVTRVAERPAVEVRESEREQPTEVAVSESDSSQGHFAWISGTGTMCRNVSWSTDDWKSYTWPSSEARARK